MKTAVISWSLPTTRADGTALAASEIAYVDVQFSADKGANFTSLNHIAPTSLSLTQTQLSPGDYIFGLIVVDKQVPPKSSAMLQVPFNVPVPVLAAPAEVGNAGVVLS